MVPACNDDNKRWLGRGQLRHDMVHVVGINVPGLREALTIGIAVAIIDDHHLEACQACDLVDVKTYVSRSNNVEDARRQHGLNKYLQSSAAHQTGVLVRGLVKIEG